ncbi:MAG TPA: hypothetical protein VF217_09135 [Rhodanobacteraceae bacterium]
MTLSRFLPWLRSRADALADRCATAIQRRRMQRAQAQLPRRAREKARLWRALYLARNARLQREREARRTRLHQGTGDLPTRDISKADVLAAIARSRANREARLRGGREEGGNE